MTENSPKRIAIACQGGGSHTAFTAGALKEILRRQTEDAFTITALSGTSGGAVCAFLAWYGLLQKCPQTAIDLLDRFWKKIAASDYWDALGNAAMVMSQHQMLHVEISPYLVPEWARQRLERALEDLVDFEALPKMAGDDAPDLMIGAVDVRSGRFHVFRRPDISMPALLGSAAIPALFRAVAVSGEYYWDGLFSHNPPIRHLARSKPDEIWVIQINPPSRKMIPQSSEEIRDRRNELSGNLSLEQELFFIEKINDWVARGVLCSGEHKHIAVRRVIMERDLPYATKIDRSPGFIRDMIAYGEDQARRFFAPT